MAEAKPPPHREPFVIQFMDKMSQLMTAAFGFVAALAWNEAIKMTIDGYYGPGEGLGTRYLYAVVVTATAVLAGLWIASTIERLRRRVGHEHVGGPGSSSAA